MGLMDILVLTISSTVACLTFPKLLSMIFGDRQISRTKPPRSKLTAFPYCTSYVVVKKPLCRFSPHFCARCSSLH